MFGNMMFVFSELTRTELEESISSGILPCVFPTKNIIVHVGDAPFREIEFPQAPSYHCDPLNA